MHKKRQGLLFNLEIFERVGWRKRNHIKVEEGNLFKDWAEIDRLVYNAYGVHLPKDFFKPIETDEKVEGEENGGRNNNRKE